MIGVKTVLTISPSSGSQFFLESLPRCWNSSRFNSSIVVRKNAILNHPRTLPGQQSPLYLVRPYYYRVGNKRNFTSLKNAKESDLKTSTSSGKASEMEGSATNIGAQQVVDSATSTNPTFLQRFLAPKEIPPRGSFGWYREMVLICTVFAITGSSTMMLVRPAVSNILGLNGSFKDGPWSYRICSLVIMTPIYASLLVVVGTVFGRHAYFRHFSVKIFSRFGIPPELMDKSYHETKHAFRKW